MTRHVPPPAGHAAPAPVPQRVPASPPAAKLRVWVMSDLRVDLAPLRLPDPLPAFDVLLVAGNVSNDLGSSLSWLADNLAGRQGERPVVLVPGNAEFWNGRGKADTLRESRILASRLGITLLSDEAVRIPDAGGTGVQVLGSTLWTDWGIEGRDRATLARGYARRFHPDCRRIRLGPRTRYLPHDAAGAHARSRAFIEDALVSIKVQSGSFGTSPVALVHGTRPGDRAIVLTHHAPSRRSLAPRPPHGLPVDWGAAAQASDLEHRMTARGAPVLGVHGHVPRPVDLRIGRTRVVANPRGRRGDLEAFHPALVLET